ncbi:MAG: C69 family dipeptidase [Bacteroidota bacterium]
MKKSIFILFIATMLSCVCHKSYSCTNILVSKGASKDGSVFISYNVDSKGFMAPLYFFPAKDWNPNDSLDIYEWDTGKFLGKIKQASHTYQVVGNINEFQLSIGETTFGGREELYNSKGVLDYGSLMYIALQRATTAREAIKVMTNLVAEYGYVSEGESFSISDPNEVWILEMIGKGKENEKGALWVARKVPDGYICVHANQSRIREVPLNDKDCLYSADLFSFAEKKGYSKPGKPFSFVDAYCPLTPGALLCCENRVWRIFQCVAPSQNFSTDYWRAVKDAEPYPLFIKPDKKIGVEDVMALMRDHFEGTEFDMTKGLAAGPYGCPYRWKPLEWKIEGDTINSYMWERSVSTQQTAFSFVSQSRSFFPNAIGGIFWYSVDDTYSNCYMPLYCGITEPPAAYQKADVLKFSWDSPVWVFNLVANYAYSKYSYIIKDIQIVQKELESKFLALQSPVEKTAIDLYKSNPKLALQYLTDYSINQANIVFERWKELYVAIVTKYNDGYINEGKDGGRSPSNMNYSQSYLKKVVQERPDYYLKRWQEPRKK